ncbi:MAG TPA: choice-of-anchor J domain-containing protein [Ignavibacteriales bacterium]|nr:choice-of-anchor J domain-containing protein [Ignavibacteriales bacterium]
MKTKITVFLLAIIAFSSAIYSQDITSKEMYSAEKQGINGAGTGETSAFPYMPGQFYKENFDGPSFPPQGWQTVDVQGANESWTYSTIQYYSDYTGGARAARINSERNGGGAGEGIDWLITPQITVSAGDSLKFYLFCYYGYGTGSLAVLVTEDENFATNGTSLNNSFTDTLTFQDLQTAPNQTWTQSLASLEKYAGKKIYIAFKAVNDGGSHLNLDAIEIGTKPQFDIEASRVNVKGCYQPGETVELVGTFTNAGVHNLTSFDVNLEIPEAGKKFSAHYEYQSAYYSYYFNNWQLTNADAGKYTAKLYVNASGDQNISNDTLYQTFTVVKTATGMAWRSETPMSGAIYDLSAAAYVKPSGSEAPDTTFLYAIGGTQNSNSVLDIQKYNTITRLWETDTTLPGAASNSRAFQVNGKIYILPGTIMSGGATYSRKLYIYDIEADTIGTGAEFPYFYAWYAAGLYGDSLIYVIGGDNQVQYSKALLVYNINNNTWTEGTPFANKGRGALSGTVCGDKIIIACGTTKDYRMADVNIGTINPDDPFDIAWENETYPGGALEDVTMGSWNGQTKKYALFTGGHTNYGSVISTTSWAYDLVKKEWLGLPPKKTTSIYSSEMVPVVRNDSVFMAVLGGMGPGYVVSNANEWLYVCPSDKAMLEQDAAAISVDFDTAAANFSMVPKATFKNMRLPETSFNVTMEITPGDYKSTKSVSALAFDAVKQVAFESWVPGDVTEYTVKIYVASADADKNNDTLTSKVKVIATDLDADAIRLGGAVTVGKEIFPKAVVYNARESAQGCTATMKIMPGNYSSTKTVGSIPQYNYANVEFDKWVPASAGKYTVTFYITAAADINTANDTLNSTVNVLDGLKTGEWLTETSAPFASPEKPAVFYTKKAAKGTGVDTGYVFLVSARSSGGKTLDMPDIDSSLIFNVNTQTWTQAPTLPANYRYIKAAYAAALKS